MDYGGTGENETVRELFAAFTRRDVEGALAYLHPEIELWAQPTEELTQRGEPYRGHDGFREYMADVDRVWETFSVEPRDFRVAGGGVICFGDAEGRPRDGGVPVRLPVIWVFRVREGRVAYCRVARTAAEATELASA